jgi:hypothetical protein
VRERRSVVPRDVFPLHPPNPALNALGNYRDAPSTALRAGLPSGDRPRNGPRRNWNSNSKCGQSRNYSRWMALRRMQRNHYWERSQRTAELRALPPNPISPLRGLGSSGSRASREQSPCLLIHFSPPSGMAKATRIPAPPCRPRRFSRFPPELLEYGS